MKTKKRLATLALCLILASSAIGCSAAVQAETQDGQSMGIPTPIISTGTVDMEYPALDGVEEMIVVHDGEQYPGDEDQTVDEQETALLEDYEFQLMQAIEMHDFEIMSSLMGEIFGFGLWTSEGYGADNAVAMQHLQLSYLVDDAEIRFPDEPDLPSSVPDGDILKVWDPATNPVSAIYSTGWGENGAGEAFLIVSQLADGSYQWSGIIYAGVGFNDVRIP